MNMNRQEVFNTVYRHLLAQGCKSLDATFENCLYRGPNGLKCAAGVLIKDEFYHKGLEGRSACSLSVSSALRASGVHEGDLEMVLDLQATHDKWEVDEWPAELAVVAHAFNVKVPA